MSRLGPYVGSVLGEGFPNGVLLVFSRERRGEGVGGARGEHSGPGRGRRGSGGGFTDGGWKYGSFIYGS